LASETTYTTKGDEAPHPKFDEELGSAISVRTAELVPELASRTVALRTFQKMARNDAVTRVSLQATGVNVLGAEYYVDPEEDDEQQADIAEFVEYNLMEAMKSTPWTYVISRVLRMYRDGMSIFEPVYERASWRPRRQNANSKNYIMLRKLAYRPTLTIKDIELDDSGGPQTVVQNRIDSKGKAQDTRIPIEKAVIFTWGDSDAYWGESILRSAYPHWFYKTHFYNVDAIQKERHGIGVPFGKLPPGYDDNDKKFLGELLQNIRANERSYFLIPPGYEIGFAKPEGQLVDVLKSASYHDMAIMLNVMAEFMLAGFTEMGGGGRNTASQQTDVFYKALLFTANFICDCFNMYIIPNLVRWNFSGVDRIPKLKVRSIGQNRDLQMFGSALANMFNAEVLTADLPTENWVRGKILDMPLKTEPRPDIAFPNVREQILLQGQAGGQPAQPTDTGSKAIVKPGGGTFPATAGATKGAVGNNGGQGNMGKAPTQG
jgi:hypothetical protein